MAKTNCIVNLYVAVCLYFRCRLKSIFIVLTELTFRNNGNVIPPAYIIMTSFMTIPR